MKRDIIETVETILLCVLLIIISLCLLKLNKDIRGVAEDLEQFKVETYDRERDLIAAKVEEPVKVEALTEKQPIEERDETADFPAEKCDEHEKADTEAAETHEKAASDYGIWDEDYILRVLTAEAGNDEVLCGCVAQVLYNACVRECWEHSPDEVLVMYGYTGPASWISDAAVQAYDEVFCSGVKYTDVADALYFYAPTYCTSEWHESQRFVCEVSGVRFFARWE